MNLGNWGQGVLRSYLANKTAEKMLKMKKRKESIILTIVGVVLAIYILIIIYLMS